MKRRFANCFWLLPLGLLTMGAQAASLQEVMDRALRVDARVPVSLAILEADHARAGLDRATLLPQISASASVGQNDQTITSEFFGSFDESYSDNGLQLELRQALFRWDMRGRWTRSELRHQLARDDRAFRRHDFLIRVVDRYSRVLEAEAEHDFAAADAEALREESATIADRKSVGLATLTDLRETEARAALAEANLLLAEDSLREAEDALIELIGAPLPTLRPLPAQLPSIETTDADMEAFVRRAAEQALDVRKTVTQLAIAKTEVSSALAEAAPQVNLVGRLSSADSSDSRTGQEVESSRIALELSMPLYTGGANRRALRASRADVDNYAAQLDLYIRQAEQEARNAWRAVQTAYRRLDALGTAAEAAQIALEATEDGVAIGKRTHLDLLEARSALLRAKRDQVLARYGVLRALARREAAVGDLDFDDYARFDALYGGRETDS